jgi:hypothetical protein
MLSVTMALGAFAAGANERGAGFFDDHARTP